MKYDEAVAYLHGLQRFGVKLGLERTQELLRRLGRPERRCGRVVHVTGTSGKGSVSAMVEAGLRAAGHRVGLYTSPSLERFTERMQVNRQDIAADALAGLVAEAKAQVEAMVAEGWEQPTEFEVTTAVGFLYFSRQQLDWLVLEVGVGGRYDATATVANTAVACITNIGLDHTDWLGSTEEKIAWEKAGIIRPAVPSVTGTEHAGALEVIRQEALSLDSVLVEVTGEDWRVVSFGPEGQVVDLYGARGWYQGVKLSLLGNHQASNAAVALRVLELCGVSEAHIRHGLGSVVWPGRMEALRLPGRATVLLDAAHNPDKCRALAEAVRQYFPERRVLLVLGALADKNVEAMAEPLVALAARVWATTPESPRQLPAAELAQVCRRLGAEPVVEPQIARCVEQAFQAAAPGDLVLITGSFYMVGPARQFVGARVGQEA